MTNVTNAPIQIMYFCLTAAANYCLPHIRQKHLKQYLHIWALLMLFIHLTVLAAISFVPAEGGAGSFKKICLRKEGKAKVAAETYTLTTLFLQNTETEVPEGETEIRLCSVKLISTAASHVAVFTTPLFLYEEPPFFHQDYFSVTIPADPAPPKIGWFILCLAWLIRIKSIAVLVSHSCQAFPKLCWAYL